MSKRSLAAIAALTCLSLISGATSWAQNDSPDRERGRAGGGRFGGPGGPPGGGMFGGGMAGNADSLMLALLRAETVRAELEIMPDQEEALQKLAERQRGERPDFDIRNASDEDRQKFFEKMQADMAKRNAEAKAQVEEVLLPAQLERLEQIVVQAQGATGLTNPETAKKLGLTTEQTEKLKAEAQAFGENARQNIGEAFRSGDRDAAREKMQAMRKELDAKLMEVLTAEQKAEFEKLKGEPFELPELSPFGRGGDRGGDRGDRGGDRGDRGGDRGGNRGERGRPEAE